MVAELRRESGEAMEHGEGTEGGAGTEDGEGTDAAEEQLERADDGEKEEGPQQAEEVTARTAGVEVHVCPLNPASDPKARPNESMLVVSEDRLQNLDHPAPSSRGLAAFYPAQQPRRKRRETAKQGEEKRRRELAEYDQVTDEESEDDMDAVSQAPVETAFNQGCYGQPDSNYEADAPNEETEADELASHPAISNGPPSCRRRKVMTAAAQAEEEARAAEAAAAEAEAMAARLRAVATAAAAKARAAAAVVAACCCEEASDAITRPVPNAVVRRHSLSPYHHPPAAKRKREQAPEGRGQAPQRAASGSHRLPEGRFRFGQAQDCAGRQKRAGCSLSPDQRAELSRAGASSRRTTVRGARSSTAR